jgi:hypothetical protein
VVSLTSQIADGSGTASWFVGSSTDDPAGSYSIAVTDVTSGRRGYGSFTIG